MTETGALAECTSTLLRNPDKIKDWLTIADKYMQTYADNPKLFVLPHAHGFMKPLIEAYALNIEGFTQYIIGLRDCFDRQSMAFSEIQVIYRRVNGRYVQQVRRERMGRAVAKAEELWGEIPYTHRMQWMADLEHNWAKRRLVFLEIQRKRIGEARIDVETRTELLLEFWDEIDTEIYEGRLPAWNLPNHGATPP